MSSTITIPRYLANLFLVSLACCVVALLTAFLIVIPNQQDTSQGIEDVASIVRAIVDGNEAAACRSSFSAAVTDANAELNVANGELLIVVTQGLTASVAKDEEAYLRAKSRAEDVSERINHARLRIAVANGRFQGVIAAQARSRAAFDKLCANPPD